MGQSKRDKRRAAERAARVIYGADGAGARATMYVTSSERENYSATRGTVRPAVRAEDRRREHKRDRAAARVQLRTGAWNR